MKDFYSAYFYNKNLKNSMTAEEFLKEKGLDVDNFVIHDISDGGYLPQIPISKWLIEFAKYHVEQALKAASQVAETEEEWSNPYDPESSYYIVNKESILNAYPLENIK